MQIQIFTLPFDASKQTFFDEEIHKFCLNKKVYDIQTQFFRQEGKVYWTVMVKYDTVLPPELMPKENSNAEKESSLTEEPLFL